MSEFLKAAEAGNIEAPGGRDQGALAKWGVGMSEGFVFLPRALVRHQAELKLNSGAMMVLLNLIGSWWQEDDHPYPRATTIAARMGVNVRTVQRHLNELEEAGLVDRVKSLGNGRNAKVMVVRYDLSGLVNKLKELAVPNSARIKDVVGNVMVPPQAGGGLN